jgi:hypothetical protein
MQRSNSMFSSALNTPIFDLDILSITLIFSISICLNLSFLSAMSISLWIKSSFILIRSLSDHNQLTVSVILLCLVEFVNNFM